MKVHSRDIFWWAAGITVAVALFAHAFTRAYTYTYEAINRKPSPSLSVVQKDDAASLAASPSFQARQASSYEGLPFEVQGIVVGAASLAFLYNTRTGMQGVYKANDTLDGYTITAIHDGYVIFEKDGIKRMAAVHNKPGAGADRQIIRKVDAGTVIIDKGLLLNNSYLVKDMLSTIKISTVIDSDSSALNGFRVDNVPRGSIVEEAGIRSGDIVYSVEGKKLTSVRDEWKMAT